MENAFECSVGRVRCMWMAALGHRLGRCTTCSSADLDDVREKLEAGRSRVSAREARAESACRARVEVKSE